MRRNVMLTLTRVPNTHISLKCNQKSPLFCHNQLGPGVTHSSFLKNARVNNICKNVRVDITNEIFKR